MKNNFDTALSHALESELCWLDDVENPYADYEFSSQFESSIKAILPKVEYTYVSVGRRRIRKTMLAALVALLAVSITGCALGVHYMVKWHEEHNDKQGTLDVTFDLEGENPPSADNVVLPETPSGYTITERYENNGSCTLVYSNPEGNQIIYSHSSNVENMSVSIDNEDANFEETIINGQKGYSSFKEGIYNLYWADTTYFYILQGTCDMDTLLTMAKSMAN